MRTLLRSLALVTAMAGLVVGTAAAANADPGDPSTGRSPTAVTKQAKQGITTQAALVGLTCSAGYFCVYRDAGDVIYGYGWFDFDRDYTDNRYFDGSNVDNSAEYWNNNGNTSNVCVFQYTGFGGAYRWIPRGGATTDLHGDWWWHRPSSHYWVRGSSC